MVDNAINGTVNLSGSRTQGQHDWNATRSAKSARAAGTIILSGAIH
jgi:hypothetical protein